MTKFLVIRNKQSDPIEPYYQINVGFVTSVYHNVYDEIDYKIPVSTFKKNPTEIIDFVKHLYICYYSPPVNSELCDDIDNLYNHVKTSCYYSLISCHSKRCNYCGKTNKNRTKSDIFEIEYRPNPIFIDSSTDLYRYQYIKMYYYDETNTSHRVKIEFSKKDIKDIVNGIIDSHTIDYYNLTNIANGPSGKFNEDDPDIFLDTHCEMIQAQSENIEF